MPKQLHVKPAPRTDGEKGTRIVRDPFDREPLPDAGKRVPDTTYWRRRLMQGDVLLVEAKKSKGGD